MSKQIINASLQPQDCTIFLYYDQEKVPYKLRNISYQLLPTGVAVCTYNTPENLNSITVNQQWETFALLEHMQRDENVRVAIWTGAGDRAFSSGANLKGIDEVMIPEHIQAKMRARGMGPVKGDFVLLTLTKAFWDFPKPSICAVNGVAVGGAANIALVNYHDIVICSEKARFMYPFAKLGLTPELGSSFMLPYLVGFAKAKEMLYLGDWLSAEEAKNLGLANKVVTGDKLLEEANKIAERLVVLHPKSLMHSKRILNSHIRKQLDNILEAENEEIKACMKATGGPLKLNKWMKDKQEWLNTVKSKL